MAQHLHCVGYMTVTAFPGTAPRYHASARPNLLLAFAIRHVSIHKGGVV